ncbi:unnamed protein product [Ixodes pacificus]
MWTEKKPLHAIPLAVLFYLCLCVLKVSSHVHTHPKSDHANGEREQDGNFASRAQNHLRDDIHETDFDHEAILGEFFRLLSSWNASRISLTERGRGGDLTQDPSVLQCELLLPVLRAEIFILMVRVSMQVACLVKCSSCILHSYTHRPGSFKGCIGSTNGIQGCTSRGFRKNPFALCAMQILYEETMKKKDADRDGYLSLEEFASEDADKPLTSEQFLVEKERFEMDYDRNGDKKLDKQETLNWLLPGNE